MPSLPLSFERIFGAINNRRLGFQVVDIIVGCFSLGPVQVSNWPSFLFKYYNMLAKMSFDEIFDLTAGVYFHFL